MNLRFGTGGLRATMAPGPDHLNIETIREATLGVAAYAKTLAKEPSVAISYDSRKNSQAFAMETARVLAAVGCQVYLYEKLMPTPALSFAVRKHACDLGIAITASHNPKEYNGYKVYGSDGCQITGNTAERIQQEIQNAELSVLNAAPSYEKLVEEGTIRLLGEETEEAFLDEIQKLRTTDAPLEALRVVYTPLHGAGADCVTGILKRIGVEKLYPVQEQMAPDGEFPTCPYPNPEEDEALLLGIRDCMAHQADLLLATDPDSDRVGVAAPKNGGYERLTGNQVGVLLLAYLLEKHQKDGTMPEKPVVIKTIVTTAMAEQIAKAYGAEVIDTLTGFKYIGEQIGLLEQKGEAGRFVFGFEESCGYLIGSYVRDKDAVGAAMVICEMAEFYRAQGKTLWDALEELYHRYGSYETALKTYHFEADEARHYMEQLRSDLKNGRTALSKAAVVDYRDYQAGIDGLPKADVVKLWLEDGTQIIVRPSGTEPKIKIYFFTSK